MKLTQKSITVHLAHEEEFRNVFDNFYIPLCIFANRYVEDESMADDIVQDCFIKLWQMRREFTFLHQIKSFLYTSIRNRCLNELEHLNVVNQYQETLREKATEEFFRDHLIEEETYRMLMKAIDELPKQMRAIMLLAFEGMSNAAIAEELNVSTENVRSLKKIAYRKLRDALKEYYYLIFLFLNV
ncbi:MAG: RNA polymerase sigma-70 factor [Prevotellaceae bacterium]|jgi:RNA polymerase sigma-70 factor (ECF subfamily)|nr:RNA polymerase sigma-70 factor [Prevotellaceae bacterium]